MQLYIDTEKLHILWYHSDVTAAYDVTNILSDSDEIYTQEVKSRGNPWHNPTLFFIFDINRTEDHFHQRIILQQ